jgi:replicative DNA helicase
MSFTPPPVSTEEKLSNLNRSLPWSNEAEMGVLSCILQDPAERLSECRTEVPVEGFYGPGNRIVYEALLAMLDAGAVIEMASVTMWLNERNLLDKVGGAGHVSELFTFIPASAHYGFYRKKVLDKLRLRRLIASCTDIVAEALNVEEYADSDPADMVASAQERVLALTQAEDNMGYYEWHEALEMVADDVADAFQNMGHIPKNRLSTGFTDLDRRTGGLEDNCFFIIAARPSQGKTSLAMNIVENVAIGEGHYKEFDQVPLPVAVYSLEMSVKSLARRSLVGGAGVNLNQVRFGLGSRNDQSNIGQRFNKMKDAKIYTYDVAGMSIERIRASARILKKRKGIRLIVIDYLQLITSEFARRMKYPRNQEIGHISKQLKAMSKELGVPVIALAQLNRNVEERGKDARPKSSDLRESGDIEQDADIIGLLKRNQYAEDDEDASDKPGATFFIDKGRDIGLEDIQLDFIGATTQFRSRTTSLLSNNAAEREQGSAAQKKAKHQPAQSPKKPTYRRDHDDGYDDTLLGND